LDRSVKRGQRLIPVIEEDWRMVEVVPWVDVLERLVNRLRGIVTQFDLLRARERTLQEERHRERVLSLRVLPRARPGDGGQRGR